LFAVSDHENVALFRNAQYSAIAHKNTMNPWLTLVHAVNSLCPEFYSGKFTGVNSGTV